MTQAESVAMFKALGNYRALVCLRYAAGLNQFSAKMLMQFEGMPINHCQLAIRSLKNVGLLTEHPRPTNNGSPTYSLSELGRDIHNLINQQ